MLFTELDPRARAAVVLAFVDRNGNDWSVPEVDVFAGHVVRARRDTGTMGEVVVLDQTGAEKLAKQAIRDNADLFGLSQDEVSALVVVGAFHNMHSGPLQWMVQFIGEAAIYGYEDMKIQRRLRVVVDIAKDGMLMGVANRSEIWPEFDICTTPMLAADDPRLFESVLGTELYYSDFAGDTQYAGTVAEENVAAVERVLHVKRVDRPDVPHESRLLIRLAYRIDVAFALLTWSFFVDPDTGAVIDIRQNFNT